MLSLIGFGFLGGITGVVYGTEQLNIISHNTLRIPGHFHATVVAGTTLAFMGITYYVLPLIFRREVAFPGIAKLQPYVFGIGIMVFSISMMFAGGFGVSRRQWDMTGVEAPFQVNFDAIVDLTMAVVGISGVLAVVGGAMYVLVAVGTLLVGKKINA